jgi:hypothetical protein
MFVLDMVPLHFSENTMLLAMPKGFPPLLKLRVLRVI